MGAIGLWQWKRWCCVTEGVVRETVSWQMLAAPGLEAVRRYWRPFVLLQAVALLLVIGYSQSAAVREVCEHLAAVKTRWGLLFSGVATALAGAILPEIAKVLALGQRHFDRRRINDISFALAIFAFNGVWTDLQYRVLAWMYGSGNDWPTVMSKVLTDQFACTPLYAVPYWIVLYAWRGNGYDLRRTVGEMSGRWYLTRVLPLLIPCWFFWIPMTMLIYSLPGPLQLWLFLFAVGAWSLVMVCVASGQTRPPAPAPVAAATLVDLPPPMDGTA